MDGEMTMDLWMYLFLIGMFLIAIIGTVWITLWTIQRGDRSRAERSENARKPE
jgi:Tfp pilus assembly protein PilW